MFGKFAWTLPPDDQLSTNKNLINPEGLVQGGLVDGVLVWLGVFVGVGVDDEIGVSEGVRVFVGVGVDETPALCVFVGVCEFVGVGVLEGRGSGGGTP